MKTEEKFNNVASICAEMMEEAVAHSRTEDMVAHVKTFSENNQFFLKPLNSEIERWLQFMPDKERTDLMIRMMAQDYSISLSRTVPLYFTRIDKHPNRAEYEQILVSTLQPLLMNR